MRRSPSPHGHVLSGDRTAAAGVPRRSSRDQISQLRAYLQISPEVEVNGDEAAARIVGCLMEIASIYGPSVVSLRYVPFCADIFDQCQRRLSVALESAAVSSLTLLHAVCCCLSDKQLMDNLQVSS